MSSRSARNSVLVGAGILISRLSGLVRERVLGHFFGVGAVADAFTAASRIPGLLQRLLGEGVLSAAFIPVYSRLLAEGRDEEAGKVAGAVAGLLVALTAVLTLLGMALAEPIVHLIAAGFAARPQTFDLTVTLTRIMFPAVGLFILSAWCLGVLNSHRRFFLSYVAPVLVNLTQIGVLLGAGLFVVDGLDAAPTRETAERTLVTWLAVATVVGAAVQVAVQIPTVLRVSRHLRPSLRLDLPGVRQTVRAFGPMVLSRGVVQISSFLQLFLASFLAVGALSVLRYSQMLYTLPVALFGMAVAAAELPELAREGRDAREASLARIQSALRRVAVLIVPTVVGYLAVGDLVVAALYQTGAFGRTEVIAVWLVLCGFTLGLLPTTSSRMLQSALYAIGDTRTPARLAVVRVAVVVALGAVLMFQLDRLTVGPSGLQVGAGLPAGAPLPVGERNAVGGDLVHLGAAGLSLASGVAAWVEYVLLRRRVRRDVGPTSLGGGRLGPLLAAAAVAGALGVAARPMLEILPPLPAGVAAVTLVAAAYLALAARMGVPEVHEVLRSVRRRLPG